MIEIAWKGGQGVNSKSVRNYRDLSRITAISFAPGIDAENHRRAYVAEKARENRARKKEYQRKLIEEVTNVRQ